MNIFDLFMGKPGKLFDVGQAVTPATDPKDWQEKEGRDIPKPAKDGIYHVREYHWFYGRWWISLEEFDPKDVYLETCFVPVQLISDEALADALSEIFQKEGEMA